jgi:hypothetical protein
MKDDDMTSSPTWILLPGEKTPVLLNTASRHGGDGWILEVFDDSSPRTLHLLDTAVPGCRLFDPDWTDVRALAPSDLGPSGHDTAPSLRLGAAAPVATRPEPEASTVEPRAPRAPRTPRAPKAPREQIATDVTNDGEPGAAESAAPHVIIGTGTGTLPGVSREEQMDDSRNEDLSETSIDTDVDDLAGRPSMTDDVEGIATDDRDADPATGSTVPADSTPVERASPGAAPPRRRWRIALLSVTMLLLGAGGGFAAGWIVKDQQTDGSVTTTETQSGALADRFDSNPGDLNGRAIPGRADATWSVESGAFNVSSDGGVTGTPTGDAPAIAIMDNAGDIRSLSATYSTVAAGAGLVFRFQDAENYWKIVAAPDFGTWAISKITDGTTQTVGDTGFGSGTTIEIIFVGNTIQFWVEGALKETLRDEQFAASRRAGLIVEPGGEAAQCTEVSANTV